MPNYLFSVYLRYSGSERFQKKVFEVRTLVYAESEEEAIDIGLDRSAYGMLDYFGDIDGVDDILYSFDLTGGLEDYGGGVTDYREIEILTDGRKSHSTTFNPRFSNYGSIKQVIKGKWRG